MNLFGTGLKAARVGDQIDAEVTALQGLVGNCKMTAQQFDFVEQQLGQFAQIIGQSDQMAAMQFTNMVNQINNTQGQIVQLLNQVETGLAGIKTKTDAIQQ